MKTYLDASILPAGYIDWNGGRFSNNTFMATYNDFGPGWDPVVEKNSNRTIILDYKGVSSYNTPVEVFATEDSKLGNIGWIDKKVLPRRSRECEMNWGTVGSLGQNLNNRLELARRQIDMPAPLAVVLGTACTL